MATECMENLTTCTFSNIGKMNLPDEMMPYVERFDFILNRQRSNALLFLQWGSNKLNITFTNKLIDSDVERDFYLSCQNGHTCKSESKNMR